MKLLLNTESLRPPLTGIGSYTFNLLQQFHSNTSIEQVGCFNGFSSLDALSQLQIVNGMSEVAGSGYGQHRRKILNGFRKVARNVPGAYKVRSVIGNRRFKGALKAISGAIYHEPNFILKDYDGPSVVTIHDLSSVLYPEYHPTERVKWLSEYLPKTLERADAIITDSDIVRNQLKESFNVSEDRVKTVYLGADEKFQPRCQDLVEDFLTQAGLEYQSYILFVGTLEPRKGVDVLLDAWCSLPLVIQQSFPLVLAGAPGWNNDELFQRVKLLTDKGLIRYLDYVPAEALPLLYSGAALFVYPSVYEGFGLPVLEAMSSGVPVICRDGTSMAEFAHGSCLLCETGKAEELADKMASILECTRLQKDYSDKGLMQSKLFSWGRCARETVDIYSSL